MGLKLGGQGQSVGVDKGVGSGGDLAKVGHTTAIGSDTAGNVMAAVNALHAAREQRASLDLIKAADAGDAGGITKALSSGAELGALHRARPDGTVPMQRLYERFVSAQGAEREKLGQCLDALGAAGVRVQSPATGQMVDPRALTGMGRDAEDLAARGQMLRDAGAIREALAGGADAGSVRMDRASFDLVKAVDARDMAGVEDALRRGANVDVLNVPRGPEKVAPMERLMNDLDRNVNKNRMWDSGADVAERQVLGGLVQQLGEAGVKVPARGVGGTVATGQMVDPRQHFKDAVDFHALDLSKNRNTAALAAAPVIAVGVVAGGSAALGATGLGKAGLLARVAMMGRTIGSTVMGLGSRVLGLGSSLLVGARSVVSRIGTAMLGLGKGTNTSTTSMVANGIIAAIKAVLEAIWAAAKTAVKAVYGVVSRVASMYFKAADQKAQGN